MDKETKLQRLQEVLNEYEPFLRNYNKIDVELLKGEFDKEYFKISYYGTKNNKAYQAYNVEIPIEDLDITIKRYREKVNYWKNKEVK
jgi:hypothetical protein